MEPRLAPLRQWYCDTCREVIELEQGYLEFVVRDSGGGRLELTNIRIIHNFKKDGPSRCHADEHNGLEPGESLGSLPLGDLTGGATQLSTLLDTLGGPSGVERVADPAVVHRIIRRLHVPYYEEAQRYFGSGVGPLGVHELLGLIRREGA